MILLSSWRHVRRYTRRCNSLMFVLEFLYSRTPELSSLQFISSRLYMNSYIQELQSCFLYTWICQGDAWIFIFKNFWVLEAIHEFLYSRTLNGLIGKCGVYLIWQEARARACVCACVHIHTYLFWIFCIAKFFCFLTILHWPTLHKPLGPRKQ